MSFLGGPLEIGLSAAFESKPEVPDFRLVDLVDQQMKTAEGNLAVLPKAEQLGTGINSYLRSERAKTLAGIPGLEDIEGGVVGNLKDWLAGRISPDLSSQVMRTANARAFGGGYGGSGMGRNLTARDLGLTGLQLQQSAMPMAQNYFSNEYRMRGVPEFDPSSAFLTPQFAAQFQAAQNQGQFNRDWLANRVAAQPEPWQQALMNTVQEGGSMADSLLMQYAAAPAKLIGGFMGGGGGGGAGAGIAGAIL